MDRPRSFGRLSSGNGDMQLIAILPDDLTGSGILRNSNGEDDGGAATTHRQHEASALDTHRLGGPQQGVKAFVFVGIAHLRVLWFDEPGGLDIGEEGMADHLHRLAMERKAPFRRLLQVVTRGPGKLVVARCLVQITAHRPDTGRFHLRVTQPSGQYPWKMIQSVDAYRFHDVSFCTSRIAHSFHTCKDRASRGDGLPVGSGAFIPIPSKGWEFPHRLLKIVLPRRNAAQQVPCWAAFLRGKFTY